MKEYLVGKVFSTDDIETETGNYDFKFKVVGFSENKTLIEPTYDFIYSIEEGSVTIFSQEDEPTYDLLGQEILELDYWDEIRYELRDIFIDFTKELTRKLKLKAPFPIIDFYMSNNKEVMYENEIKEDDVSLKNRVENLIQNFGLMKAIKSVGNVQNFSKIMGYENINPQELLRLLLSNKTFNEKDLNFDGKIQLKFEDFNYRKSTLIKFIVISGEMYDEENDELVTFSTRDGISIDDFSGYFEFKDFIKEVVRDFVYELADKLGVSEDQDIDVSWVING
jgi:hypothetical protein